MNEPSRWSTGWCRPRTTTTSRLSRRASRRTTRTRRRSTPARSFRGREQVRRNWEQIFAFVPDLRAEVTRSTIDGETVWTEWEMTGTRRDGTAHQMRGIVLFGVRDGVAQWARFYLEPVDLAGGTVDDAVREQVVRR